jgi:hypothetical protein
MNNETADQELPDDTIVEELLAQLSDPIHRRIIQAHRGVDPVQSMESEIGEILLEVLNREN